MPPRFALLETPADGVFRFRVSAQNMAVQDLTGLPRIETPVLDRRLPGILDGDHGLHAAESRAPRNAQLHVRASQACDLVVEGREDVPASGCDAQVPSGRPR
jgi:hypothetical protein